MNKSDRRKAFIADMAAKHPFFERGYRSYAAWFADNSLSIAKHCQGTEWQGKAAIICARTYDYLIGRG